MTFEEWWTQRETVAGCALKGADNASAAWDYQQERIDELSECLEQALSELEYWQDKANELEYNKTGV